MISIKELGDRKCEEHLSGTTEFWVEEERAGPVLEERRDERSPYYHPRLIQPTLGFFVNYALFLQRRDTVLPRFTGISKSSEDYRGLQNPMLR